MFKRCNYPRAGPNEDPQNPPRPPLGEHGGNAQMAESSGAALLVASAAFAAKQEYQSVDEDPLFSTAVNGLMSLFGGAAPAPSAQPSWSSAYACADVADADETDDGAYSTAPAMPTRAPSPTMFGGVGLNGKKLRSTRCGQCRGCNSGDCGARHGLPAGTTPPRKNSTCSCVTCTRSRVQWWSRHVNAHA